MDQHFHGNVDQVAGGNIVNAGMISPPPGHPNGRHYPQCSGFTWRRTERCIRCGFDLAGYDKKMASLKVMVVAAIFFVVTILFAHLGVVAKETATLISLLALFALGIASKT
ncbi:MAG: hypothetical protein LBL48_06860 [Azoarcus sp.]|jgi:hypothetical protein|nr:hypothetical protein [Azoarcus sp.]